MLLIESKIETFIWSMFKTKDKGVKMKTMTTYVDFSWETKSDQLSKWFLIHLGRQWRRGRRRRFSRSNKTFIVQHDRNYSFLSFLGGEEEDEALEYDSNASIHSTEDEDEDGDKSASPKKRKKTESSSKEKKKKSPEKEKEKEKKKKNQIKSKDSPKKKTHKSREEVEDDSD